jgi:HAD superfamily hydrolase (TIGR01549 family)
MLFTHYFWDFDGTLFDTYPRICRAMKKALAECAIVAPDDELLRLVKVSLRRAADEYGARGGVSADEIMKRYHAHAEDESYDSMLPYAGAVDFLRAVTEHGGKNYLYTHRGHSGVRAIDHYGLSGLFSDFVTREDGFPHKPAPDALNYLCEKHGLDKRACVMLGDRDIDLDSGKNAGMACALFDPDGFYPDYQTPYRAKTFSELQKLLIG